MVTCVLPARSEHVGTIWTRGSPLPARVWSDLRSAGAPSDAPVPDANPYGGDAP